LVVQGTEGSSAMDTNTSLGQRILTEELSTQRLLEETTLVGGIYSMGFESCLVITNDLWKARAGGIPQHCFLLASATDPGEVPRAEDDEVLLLRVIGPGQLPASRSHERDHNQQGC
jgi:hypothetical protein